MAAEHTQFVEVKGGRIAYEMIEGAGHYPNAQFPERVAAAIIPFLAEHAGAARA